MKFYAIQQLSGREFIMEVHEFDSKWDRAKFLSKANRRNPKLGRPIARKAGPYTRIVKAAEQVGFPALIDFDEKEGKWIPLKGLAEEEEK